ncbi:uncharacterized protein MKK02DRAFT_39545 [Dioszegia hungarica]|uniref:Uncharacterized protein n=1 Tax=Dioszegia hungarica TaxID=4972 RepID=A0AA38HHF2_9TREE|nr:uncharacterized protein MKK02DRAFT_39545 [Dioszegia hungarica]KAI9639249.1 hypothetical protein MKK02DRAFT_39545 [Dioszegia hungarica]
MSTPALTRPRRLANHPYATPPTSSSETELDSPVDYPVSPTDPTMDHVLVHSESLDSAGAGAGIGGEGEGVSRAPSNSSFFNNVFLDTPDKQMTRPLKVKKRAMDRAAPVGPTRMRRRSTHSLPRSPVSPTYPSTLPHRSSGLLSAINHSNLARDNSTASSAHRAITQSFYALSPALSTSPLPPVPLITHSSATPSPPSSRSSSASSAIHLGLGRFAAFDPSVLPGPSPPTSPALTPGSGAFTPPPRHPGASASVCAGASKPLPASPITPTRAPSKAAKLLGTDVPPLPLPLKHHPHSRSLSDRLRSAAPSTRAKKPQHFRPLPNSTLVDIQRFFGDVPKPSAKPPVRKGILKTHGARAKVTAASMALRDEDKAVPLAGKGDGHQDGEGRMWLDVEEEQEFAWLMSDLTSELTPGQRARVERAAGLGREVIGEEEWGMEEFTSVLGMKKAGLDSPRKSPAERKKDKGGTKVFESFLDLGLEDEPVSEIAKSPAEKEAPVDAQPKMGNRSISNPVLLSPSSLHPGTGRPTAGLAARSVSTPARPPRPPAPTAVPPIRPSTPPRPLRPAPSGVGVGSTSPQRPKHRPPPLDLAHLPPTRGLPIAIAVAINIPGPGARPLSLEPAPTPRTATHSKSRSVDSPVLPVLVRPVPTDIPGSAGEMVFPSPLFVSYGQRAPGQGRAEMAGRVIINHPSGVPRPPTTPFKHPRRAPIPGAGGSGAVPPVPSLYFSSPHRSASVSTTSMGPGTVERIERPQWGKTERERMMDLKGMMDSAPPGQGGRGGRGAGYADEGVSYFEPPSPTGPGGRLGAKAKAGGAWFKKVVRL